jgi:hypothetical protein
MGRKLFLDCSHQSEELVSNGGIAGPGVHILRNSSMLYNHANWILGPGWIPWDVFQSSLLLATSYSLLTLYP